MRRVARCRGRGGDGHARGARRSPPALTGVRAAAIGFVVRGPRSVYFAGDRDLFESMGELEPDLDLALLPVWGWGPRIGPGHLNPERAARAAQLLAHA